jgi:succinoglycan biosynthesis transport protein ExoP
MTPHTLDYGMPPTLGGWQPPPPLLAPSQSTPIKVIFRWKWRILGFACLVTMISAIIIWNLTPRYSATASVTIDVRQMRVINPDGLLSSPMLDESLVRSDMEAFGSIDLARSVVNALKLNSNPAFCGSSNQSPNTGCNAPVDEVAKKVMALINATNDGRSYIIAIRAEAGDGSLAAALANAYANEFVTYRQKMRADVSKKATVWLSSYVEQLRKQSIDADTAVSRYRNEHHLIPLRGETAAAQNVSALNAELATLANDIAQKQSTRDQVQNMLHDGGDVSSVAPLLNSPLVTGLIDRESGLANNEAELKSQYGSAHPLVVAATARVAQMRGQVRSEVSRAVAGLNREVAALNQRKAMLSAQMAADQSKVGEQGADDVGLQALESNALSARNVYQSGTTRLREIEAEGGMAQSDASLASEAIVPDKPDFPHKAVMLAGAFLGSLGLGTMLAFGLGLLSGVFRDADHLEEETGLRMLGAFPRPDGKVRPEDIASGSPLSIHGESLHSVLINLMSAVPTPHSGVGKVVLVTSAIPGEGKTSFSLALGRSAMRSGLSTVLVDCDLRSPSVEILMRNAGSSSEIQQGPASGQAIGDDATSRSLVIDRSTGLHVIPMRTKTAVNQMLSASVIRALLQQLRDQYDLIILDLPPVLAVADSLTLAPMADGVVLVVDFHRTPRIAFADAVKMLQRNGAYIAGTVFSKGELQKYARAYGRYGYLLSDLQPGRAIAAGK